MASPPRDPLAFVRTLPRRSGRAAHLPAACRACLRPSPTRSRGLVAIGAFGHRTVASTDSEPPFAAVSSSTIAGTTRGARRIDALGSSAMTDQKPATPPDRADVVIIGAGHNGLVSALLLARAGLDVVVLESAPVLGGATRTERPFPRVPG